jgi:hypothetical protein
MTTCYTVVPPFSVQTTQTLTKLKASRHNTTVPANPVHLRNYLYADAQP